MMAAKLGEPDLVPICAWLDPVPVEKITGKAMIGGAGYTSARKSDQRIDIDEISVRNQRLMNEACRRLGLDAFNLDTEFIYERGYEPDYVDSDTYIDHFRRVWRIREDVKTTYWIDGLIKSPEDLDRFRPPDPDEMCYDIVDITVEEAADEYPVIAWCHLSETISWQMRGGIDKMVQDIYRKPEFARRLIGTVAEINLEIVKRVMDRGVDLIVWDDDIADSKSPYYPRRIFEDFYFSYAKRLIQECRKRDVLVMKHSDGNLYPILDELIALGINGLHPIEPGVMDLADVKKKYGKKIFLMGNVDCVHVLPYGSEEDVRKDVRRCIDAAAEGGGFILADSNSIHNNCKVENVWTMVDEARKYGRYPTKQW